MNDAAKIPSGPHDDEATAIDRGRASLSAWLDAQPTNFYSDDPWLQRVLARVGGERFVSVMGDRLHAFGATCATVLDEAASVNNRPWNLPRLDRFDAIGRRTEGIEHHPSYHVAGRAIYESGMMGEYAAPGGFLRSLAFFHLSSMCGEAGHNCPVACTAGIIKSLQTLGTQDLKDRYLPGLLSRSYDERLDGAQFLTEVQGGSDVGANATRATPSDDGTWRIWGEKWFCSNADADLILMTARFDTSIDGTRGLGLFLVPRQKVDGTTNDFVVRRLKDKIGTRSMPSGEMDFHGAHAYALGDVGDGFKNMMTNVINTSRIYNAVAVTGAARRAMFVARAYAHHREAFGGPIARFPLVQQTVAELVSETDGMLASTFELIDMADRHEAGVLTDEEQAYMRVAVNVQKLRTSISATTCTLRAIEVLGGNGAIESFSILPRLLRDMIVCENWEGTHNTLTAQVTRDMQRYKVHEGFLDELQRRWESLEAYEDAGLTPLRDRALHTIGRVTQELVRGLDTRDPGASLLMRPLMDHMGYLMYTTAVAQQAAHESSAGASDHARRALISSRSLWNRSLGSVYGTIDADTLGDLQTLSAMDHPVTR